MSSKFNHFNATLFSSRLLEHSSELLCWQAQVWIYSLILVKWWLSPLSPFDHEFVLTRVSLCSFFIIIFLYCSTSDKPNRVVQFEQHSTILRFKPQCDSPTLTPITFPSQEVLFSTKYFIIPKNFNKIGVQYWISRLKYVSDQMFCFQCEQTRLRKGCTTIGVCGKTPEVAELQDLLVHVVKGTALYSYHAKQMGVKVSFEILDFTFSALFRWERVVQIQHNWFELFCLIIIIENF